MKNGRKAKLVSLGFMEVITIILIILKLTNMISWSWLWVFLPLWLPFVTIISMMLIFYLIIFLYFKI